MTRVTLAGVMCAAAMVITASPVRAEIVFFSSGHSLSVKGHEHRGDAIVLQLRGGGEITSPAATIARIEADEVPYPEPAPPPVAPQADGGADVPGAAGTPPESPEHRRYSEIIQRVSAEQGVDPRLVHAVIQVESNYQARARSPKGAIGLMQLLPSTARQYAVTNLYDPASNIEAGIKHLKSLLDRFPLSLALAAYNAGEAAVQRFQGIPPYQETRNYVSRILKITGS